MIRIPPPPDAEQQPSNVATGPLVSGPPVAGSGIGTVEGLAATAKNGSSPHGNSSDLTRDLGDPHSLQPYSSEAAPASELLPNSSSSLLAPKPLPPKPSPAFGKSQVNRLMKSLFPHSRALAEDSPNGSGALTDAETAGGVTSDPKL